MSGAEPLRDDRRGTEPHALEPSMEEILASIRRILADGQGLWSGLQERHGEGEDPEPRCDGPETGRSTMQSGGSSELPAARRSVAPGSVESQRPMMPARRDAALASAATEASVAAAFQTLVASRFAHDTDLVADLTREMIRPLLEAWIDENLPGIVERLVAAEIARITRGE